MMNNPVKKKVDEKKCEYMLVVTLFRKERKPLDNIYFIIFTLYVAASQSLKPFSTFTIYYLLRN